MAELDPWTAGGLLYGGLLLLLWLGLPVITCFVVGTAFGSIMLGLDLGFEQTLQLAGNQAVNVLQDYVAISFAVVIVIGRLLWRAGLIDALYDLLHLGFGLRARGAAAISYLFVGPAGYAAAVTTPPESLTETRPRMVSAAVGSVTSFAPFSVPLLLAAILTEQSFTTTMLSAFGIAVLLSGGAVLIAAIEAPEVEPAKTRSLAKVLVLPKALIALLPVCFAGLATGFVTLAEALALAVAVAAVWLAFDKGLFEMLDALGEAAADLGHALLLLILAILQLTFVSFLGVLDALLELMDLTLNAGPGGITIMILVQVVVAALFGAIGGTVVAVLLVLPITAALMMDIGLDTLFPVILILIAAEVGRFLRHLVAARSLKSGDLVWLGTLTSVGVLVFYYPETTALLPEMFYR